MRGKARRRVSKACECEGEIDALAKGQEGILWPKAAESETTYIAKANESDGMLHSREITGVAQKFTVDTLVASLPHH